jgi:hypothetical protein
MTEQCPCRCKRKKTARSYSQHSIIGFDNVSCSGKQVDGLAVGSQQKSLQVAQRPVRAPFLSELHGGSAQVSLELLQFNFEPGEKSEGVGRRARKTHENAIIVNAPYLFGVVLDDGVPKSYLTITGNHRPIASFDQKDCGPMKISIVSIHNGAV